MTVKSFWVTNTMKFTVLSTRTVEYRPFAPQIVYNSVCIFSISEAAVSVWLNNSQHLIEMHVIAIEHFVCENSSQIEASFGTQFMMRECVHVNNITMHDFVQYWEQDTHDPNHVSQPSAYNISDWAYGCVGCANWRKPFCLFKWATHM